MTEGCVFCKIVRKEVPASVVYEDNQIIAFLDIRPLSEGHTLVIPREHYENIFDIPEGLLAQIHKNVKRIAIAVKQSVDADGISIIQQNGRAADQDVFHLHVHIIPRFDGQRLSRFGDLVGANRDRLDQIAAKIRQQL